MTWNNELIELFCNADDFCLEFEPEWNGHLLKGRQRSRKCRMALSEIMTIAIHFHQSGYRTFKKYYTIFIRGMARYLFPSCVSYGRFIELMQGTSISIVLFFGVFLAITQGSFNILEFNLGVMFLLITALLWMLAHAITKPILERKELTSINKK